jgi:hypothetical protein
VDGARESPADLCCISIQTSKKSGILETSQPESLVLRSMFPWLNSRNFFFISNALKFLGNCNCVWNSEAAKSVLGVLVAPQVKLLDIPHLTLI